VENTYYPRQTAAGSARYIKEVTAGCKQANDFDGFASGLRVFGVAKYNEAFQEFARRLTNAKTPFDPYSGFSPYLVAIP
jgi:hypothetical protein